MRNSHFTFFKLKCDLYLVSVHIIGEKFKEFHKCNKEIHVSNTQVKINTYLYPANPPYSLLETPL